MVIGSTPYDPVGEPGQPLFRLASGANHLIFANLHCSPSRQRLLLCRSSDHGLVITDVNAANVRRFFENASGEGRSTPRSLG